MDKDELAKRVIVRDAVNIIAGIRSKNIAERSSQEKIHTDRTTVPKPLIILSTSSSPNVLLNVPHRKNDGSPSLVSPDPATRRHKSSSNKYASRAAGLSAIEVGEVDPDVCSIVTSGFGDAATSRSGGGMSTLKVGGGREARIDGSSDALVVITKASSSPTRSNTNMNNCRSVAEAVEATTGILEVDNRWDNSSA